MHILLVDGSKSTEQPLIALLRQQGYRRSYLQDGRAAFAAYQAEPPDLVLMDVVMPEMDGIEATRRIKVMCAGMGIAMMPQHGSAAPAILSAADHAMHEAKRGGKRRAVVAGAPA